MASHTFKLVATVLVAATLAACSGTKEEGESFSVSLTEVTVTDAQNQEIAVNVAGISNSGELAK